MWNNALAVPSCLVRGSVNQRENDDDSLLAGLICCSLQGTAAKRSTGAFWKEGKRIADRSAHLEMKAFLAFFSLG